MNYTLFLDSLFIYGRFFEFVRVRLPAAMVFVPLCLYSNPFKNDDM